MIVLSKNLPPALRLFFSGFTVILIGFGSLKSQQTTFAYRYANGNIGNCVRQTVEGDYVVLGGEDRYGLNTYEVWDSDSANWKMNADIFLMKAGPNGEMIWQKHIGSDTTRETGTWFEITPDGGYVLVGSSTKEKHLSSFPLNMIDSSDIVVVKTDANGVEQWSKKFDSGKDDYGFCVQVTADSGYIVSGFTDSSPVSDLTTTRAWVIRLDPTGNLLWEGKYQFGIRDLTNHKPFPYFAKELMNHDIAIVGTTFETHAADLFVIRTNSAGVVLWSNAYVDPMANFSGGYDLTETPDSSLIICGFRDKNRMMSQYNYPYVVKLSAAGVLIASKIFDYVSFRDRAGFSSVTKTADGNYAFTGQAGYGEMGEEIILMKADTNLNMIWSRHFDFGGTILGGAKTVRQTHDGGYILTGIFHNAGISLLKMDTIGNIACNVAGMIMPMPQITNTIAKSPDTLQGIFITNWNPPVANPLGDSIGICSVSNPLAAEKFSLKAKLGKDSYPNLQWKLDENLETTRFKIMKNKAGNFEEIAVLPGSVFEFSDPDPIYQTALYYILAIDPSGNRFQSETVEVIPGLHQGLIQNAFVENDFLTVKMVAQENRVVIVRMLDITGKLVFQESIEPGQSSLVLPVNGFPAGMFLLTATDDFGNHVTRKIVLVN